MEQWKTIYRGHVGTRRVTVERNDDAVLRACTTLPGTKREIKVTGETLGQLQERLIEYGIFTEPQAAEVTKGIIYH